MAERCWLVSIQCHDPIQKYPLSGFLWYFAAIKEKQAFWLHKSVYMLLSNLRRLRINLFY